MKRLFTLFLAAMMLLSAASAQELRLYYAPGSDEGHALFSQQYPDVSLVHATGEDYINTTEELLGQLFTGSFDWDVFSQSTRFGDPQLLMRKGYCADLSGSEIIRSHVERMRPVIAGQLMQDGRIYGIPTSMQTDMFLCNEEVWLEAGYTAEDVPSTFPEFLDFLKAWADRKEEDELSFNVLAYWDETLYNRYSYAQWLVKKLLESHITQLQFAGEPLRFATEDMIALLEDAKATGLRIYETERIKTDASMGPPLFLVESDAWGQAGQWLISMRLREDQPELLPVILGVCCVRAGSDVQAEAIEYLEAMISSPSFMPVHDALFYQDAQPIFDPNLPDQLAYVTALRDILLTLRDHPGTPLVDIVDLNVSDERLESYQHWYRFMQDAPDPDLVQERIDKWNQNLERMRQNVYLFSPAQLEDYAAFADKLIFPVPSPFALHTDGGQQMLQLIRRFVDGQLSARQLAMELDRMASMIEMENQ